MVYKLQVLEKFRWDPSTYILLNSNTEKVISINKYEIQGIQTVDLIFNVKLLVEEIYTCQKYVLEYINNDEVLMYQISDATVISILRKIKHGNEGSTDMSDMHDMPLLSSIPEYIKYIRVKNQQRSEYKRPDIHLSKVGFYKPSNEKINTDIEQTLKLEPKSYFKEKYYFYIYSVDTKASYFVKNNIGKLRLLCKNQSTGATEATIAFRNILEDTFLSISDFDIKYKTMEENLTFEEDSVSIIRNKCLYRDWKIRDVELINNNQKIIYKLNCIYKIRELTLQIIICLELLTFTNLDKQFINFQSSYKEKLQISAINIASSRFMKRKNNKKKQKANKNNTDVTKIEKKLDIGEVLDIWVDKLCIAQTLLHIDDPHVEGTEKLLNNYITNKIFGSSTEESLLGLHKHLLLPYYSRKLPNVVKYISTKLKGTSFNKKVLESTKDNKDNSTTASLRKTGSAKKYPKTIERQPSNLSELLQDKLQNSALYRSQSDLNMLEKRLAPINDVTEFTTKSTISMNKGSSFLSKSIGENHTYKRAILESTALEEHNSIVIDGRVVKRAKLTSSSSFQRVGKRQPFGSQSFGSNKDQPSNSQVQVEGTPLTKTQNDIIESPQTAKIINSPLMQFASSRKSPYDNPIQSDTREDPRAENLQPVRRKLFPSG